MPIDTIAMPAIASASSMMHTTEISILRMYAESVVPWFPAV
jgi:hypothetical protein